MPQYTRMGPGGAPMMRPYGSFAGKPASSTLVHNLQFHVTVGALKAFSVLLGVASAIAGTVAAIWRAV